MVECKSSWLRGLLSRLIGYFTVLALHGAIFAIGGDLEGSGGGVTDMQPLPSGSNNSNDTDNTPLNPGNTDSTDLSRCISVSDAVNRSLIFDVCIDYLPTSKQFIYDYNVDFAQLKSDLQILDASLVDSPYSSPPCMDLARAYTCNYVYPGCSKETGLPQGICKEECKRYVLNSLCVGEFVTFEQVTNNVGRYKFTRQCENTLLLLQDTGIGTDEIDLEDCVNITETLSNIPGMRAVAVEVTTTIVSSSSTTVAPSTHGQLNLSQLLAVVLSTVSVVLLSLLAVVIIMVNTCRAKNSDKKEENPLQSYTITNHYSMGGSEKEGYEGSEDLFQLSEEDVRAFCKDENLRKALVATDNLYITGELGEGAFGRVFKGLLVTEDPGEPSGRRVSLIAIKTVKNTQGKYQELKAFIEESALMCSFHHPHVMGTVGICLDTLQSPYLLLPYMANGDLRTFLRNKRDPLNSSNTIYPEGLDHDVLVRMCYEVACGMEYLASKKLVHRDLAARNCMVDQDLTVKVADFGLARVIYQTDYYRQHQQTKVPVKWMAPESLHDMISTEKSDVWSYGVVCWEVFSLGRLPYPTLANHEVVDYLERGNRLKKPALCSDIIYKLMLSCWSESTDKRLAFSEIISWYHEGVVPGSRNEADREVEGYVVLGPEKEMATEVDKREKAKTSLTDSSFMDITMVREQERTVPTGTTFDIIFLNQSTLESGTPPTASSKSDSEYNIEMSSLSSDTSVIVNQSALENEYDSIPSESKGNGHVTNSVDHMTKLRELDEYIVMQSAEPVTIISS